MPLINILKICKEFIAKNITSAYFSLNLEPIRDECFSNSTTKIYQHSL